ncbi:radical SAM protein [Catenovulum sediminis]|uniref:radical SAM protein n=1 Tax=Catenovulum sediminis TaxID=1740262 RepID=UPI00163D5996|nr:radical SAM protein [Catenovulum sediminis]
MEHKTRKLLASLSEQYFELIIYPTEKCNFRCIYCYESFDLGKMPFELQSSIKTLLSNNIPRLTTLSLSFFGGEPTLAIDVISNISGHASKMCKLHNVKLVGSMTTNGYKLTPELMNELVDLGITEYQISLDGTREAHDSTRVTASGNGTFSKIWSNLIDLQASYLQFNIVLRVHVTSNNFNSVKQLLLEIKEQFGNDTRFNVFIKPIENLGGSNKHIPVLNKNSRKSKMGELNDILASTQKASKDRLKLCYASRVNSFAVRADGRIQKCTVKLEDPNNTVGQLNTDGTMELDTNKLKKWMRGYSDGDLTVLSCPANNFPKNQGVNSIEIVEL